MINVHEGAGLVKKYCGKGDSKFGRNNSQATLLPFGRGIVVVNRFAALQIVCFFENLLIHQGYVPIFQLLIEMCLLIGIVEIDLAKLLNGHLQMIRDFFHV